MRTYIRMMLFAGLALCMQTGFAAGMALKDRDCAKILESYANDPGSVSQALLDGCQEQLSNLPDIAVSPAAGLPKDPCSGPDAGNSVYCWGPWSFLPPAAGGTAPQQLVAVEDPTLRPDQFPRSTIPVPGDTPSAPLGSCTPGGGCGFATIAAGLVAQPADTSNSSVVAFDMDPAAGQYIIDPNGDLLLTSNPGLQRSPLPGTPRYQVTIGDIESKLFVLQGTPDVDGNYDLAGGIWRHGNISNPTPPNTNSGVFAWGIASTMDTIDALNAGNVTANFSGAMTGYTNTLANITVNFGSQPAWTGSWQNPAFNFSAGGAVQQVDLISDPAQFSSNVVSGTVQGALLGPAGNQSVAHAVDVQLDTGGGSTLIVRDVGLLPQVP